MVTSVRNNSPDVFVHVPKAYGSSLMRALINHHGADRVYNYSEISGGLIRTDKLEARPERPGGDKSAALLDRMPRAVLVCTAFAGDYILKKLSTSPDKVFAEAAAVIGHFTVDRYATHQDANSSRMYTIVRDPLERMVSQYRHARRAWKISRSHRTGWLSAGDASLCFRDFALSAPLQNFQTRYTGTDLGRFDLVGTTENIGEFMVDIGLVSQPSDVPQINRSPGDVPEDIYQTIADPGFVRDFRVFHAGDIAFYEIASQTFSLR